MSILAIGMAFAAGTIYGLLGPDAMRITEGFVPWLILMLALWLAALVITVRRET